MPDLNKLTNMMIEPKNVDRVFENLVGYQIASKIDFKLI